jgi:RNA polymerase sigma factor (sigma-70 family)
MCHLATFADGELLAAFQASRSPEAFAALVARHAPWVQRLCRRRLGRHQDAEDATQTVFLALARQPERVHYSLSGWLYRAAQRAVKDLQRAAARRARREEVALVRRPDRRARTTELREEVAVALGRLPTRLRQPLVLRYLEGLGQREAAQRLGCPQGTLATRTREGLLRLRSLASPLKSCGGSYTRGG